MKPRNYLGLHIIAALLSAVAAWCVVLALMSVTKAMTASGQSVPTTPWPAPPPLNDPWTIFPCLSSPLPGANYVKMQSCNGTIIWMDSLQYDYEVRRQQALGLTLECICPFPEPEFGWLYFSSIITRSGCLDGAGGMWLKPYSDSGHLIAFCNPVDNGCRIEYLDMLVLDLGVEPLCGCETSPVCSDVIGKLVVNE